ncbi:helix-turn-helix transcriptional regulator [Burkholderia sp. JSH-S8]|uniref:AraC family transcriptional regulator n=1 Tax=Burkholderia stagnalis TaxID=1503054 RepID=UPI00030BDAD8|nr:helix-turn-helix transcriptional regulator [Burkholderia stagnalis]WGS44890.1 helix-turn-helix transcriptional regulator [Burkholderia sp. JSH-S8]
MFIHGDPLDPHYPDRIDRSVVVLGLGMVTDDHLEMPFHAHRKAQLLFADSGLITLETASGVWVVPPQSAVWIPGGTEHRAQSCGMAQGFVLFVEPGAAPGLPETCRTISVSPFMRALLERTASLPERYEIDGPDGRLMTVLIDELIAAPHEWLHLPMPIDPRLRKLADALLSAPAEHVTLDRLARRIGMSERSMTRLFASETGLSVSRWRRQMHVLAAMPMLAQGRTIQSIADELGYDSSGAFVTMFRKAVGTPPRRFLAERTSASPGPLHAISGRSHEFR